jgi:hypothetical protein
VGPQSRGKACDLPGTDPAVLCALAVICVSCDETESQHCHTLTALHGERFAVSASDGSRSNLLTKPLPMPGSSVGYGRCCSRVARSLTDLLIHARLFVPTH